MLVRRLSVFNESKLYFVSGYSKLNLCDNEISLVIYSSDRYNGSHYQNKAPSTRIRIDLKTDKYLSVFKFIGVHRLPFVNRFWCPHVNAKTIWKRWRRLLSMLFRAKHVPAVSRILSLNPLGCALGLLKLINSVRMARNPWQHGCHARASMSNSVLGYKRVAKSLQGKQCTFS